MTRPPPDCRRTASTVRGSPAIGQLEIAGPQILDGPRLRVGDHDVERDRFVRRRR